jgi:hypothetical protein
MLVTVLVASAVKLLGASNQVLGIAVGAILAGWGATALVGRTAAEQSDEAAADATLPG